MPSINKVFMTGNLVRDCECQVTQNGTDICKFCIAVTDSKKTPNGEWTEYANYIDCTLFGTRIHALKDKLNKGLLVTVEGKLHQSRWETKDGQKRSKVDVTVDNIILPREAFRQQSKPSEDVYEDIAIPF